MDKFFGASIVALVLFQLAWIAFVIFVIVKVLAHFGIL